MKALKQSNKLIIVLTTLIILMVLVTFGDVFMANMVAYADSVIGVENVEEKCRNYTDSYEPNGINLNEYLNDYISRLDVSSFDISTNTPCLLQGGSCFASNVSYTGQALNVTASIDGDDNIVKLIPRELFTYANKTLFVGKKYGFLVVTNCSNTGFCTSTVIIIKVENSVSDYLADITLTISKAFDFAYITAGHNSTLLPKIPSLATSGINVTYTLGDGVTTAVAPVPGVKESTNGMSVEKHLCYFESERYTLANISFGAKICSQNKYNQWDSQYEASGDTGYFFTGNNYYYSASKHNNSGFHNGITEVSKGVISAGIDKVISIAEDAASNAVIPLKVASTILKVCDTFIPLSQNIEYKETNGKYGYGYDAQYLPNTKQGQISAYGDLVKASHMVLSGTDEDVLYFKEDDFANAQFSYSHTDGVYDYTQFEFRVGANIYDNSRNNVGAVVSASSYYDINTPSAKIMDNYVASDYYLLPYGTQVFSYSPSYCSEYVVEDLDSAIELYLNNVKQSRQSDGSYELKLSSGNSYTILLKNKSYVSDSGQLLLMPKFVSQGNNTLQLDANATSVVSITPTASGVYTISMPNAIVKDVLTKNANGIGYDHNNTLSTNDNSRDEVSVYLKAGNTYIILLKNSASTTLSGTLSVQPLNRSWSVGTNASCPVYPEVTYYSFTVPSDDTATVDYVFTFTNAQNVHFIVVDEDGVLYTNTIEMSSDGWLLARYLTPGKTYYIGIYGNQDIDVTPICAKNVGDSYTWKVYDGNTLCSAEPSGTYLLQRGKSYTVTLWVNNNYKYTNVAKTFDGLDEYTATSAVYDNGTGKLTLTADRDIASFLTLTAGDLKFVSLNVKTAMNSNEIGISIDYVNKIQANFTKSELARQVNFIVSGKNAYGTSINKPYNTTGSEYTTGLKDLYSALAVGVATIRVVSVEFYNKYEGRPYIQTIDGVAATVDCSTTDIYNALQFYNIRYHDSDRFKVKNSIDFSTLGENVNWIPIPELNGVIIGNFYILKGIKMVIPASVDISNVGLIRTITSTGSVTGLVLHNLSLTSATDHDKDWINVGGIAGQNNGTVSFCTVKGTITCNRNCASIGGIIGANSGTVGYNSFVGTVYGNGDMGGIIGINAAGSVSYNSVTDSFIKHYVVDEARSVGGIIGYCCGGSVANSTVKSTSISIENTSDVKKIKTRMGIVIGHLSSATVKNNNTIENCTTSTGKLKKTDYCFKYYNGQIGNMSDATVE